METVVIQEVANIKKAIFLQAILYWNVKIKQKKKTVNQFNCCKWFHHLSDMKLVLAIKAMPAKHIFINRQKKILIMTVRTVKSTQIKKKKKFTNCIKQFGCKLEKL